MIALLRRGAPSFLLLGASFAAWEALASADSATVRLIPSPSAIFAAMANSAERLVRFHIPTTLYEALIGTLIALIIGVCAAALLDFLPLLRRAAYPLLVISQTIPLVAIAPLLILIFGFGVESKIVIVALFAFFPITVATLDGLTSTDTELVALLRSMGATGAQIWRKVRLPSALPSLFSGLRIAATYAIGSAMIGEFVTAQYGLGQYLRQAFNQSRLDQGFAAVIIASALSVIFVMCVRLVERLFLRWYFTPDRESGWQTQRSNG
ncbi:MAG: nitrate ABC transporter permease [Candidatus Thermofonsia Clade 1 bacterium]|jgi:ABC-type nitrate/sulfonate/bicarbonate transport system permease component|uniref:Nitrate ABC transporter permease n=1 Tax=Candidatus Thermofonsia Clade 1 bacterium TaxID=2364210 RepID=A0A2M8P1P1_9CHLR|nr:MAG: nitrate ABC transporter permease [Candidatus Thermofonsia Clade 1 bacterium]